MNKISVSILAAVAGFALAASADIIYWMADPEEDFEFTAARISTSGGQVTTDGYAWAAENGVVSYAQTDLTINDTTSLSFFVELLNGSSVVGRSSDYNYAQIQQYIYSGGMSMPPAGMWTVTVFTPVPEPTSGMLLVIGGAMLALRRRRVRA